MNPQKLALKHPAGWFAAGREVGVAAQLLSDIAFKVFVYLCLNANRHTGTIMVEVSVLAGGLGKREAEIVTALNELTEVGACLVRDGYVEISDGFWPYLKCARAEVGNEQAEYIRQVRAHLTEPACVQPEFTPAEEQLAIGLYNPV